jgi:glutamate racemase
MKIGFFDSGLGGLSVLYQAQRELPGEQFVYYADEEHVPYGEKSRAEIEGYVADIIGFLLRQDVKAIVIACNTATSVATKEFRSRFPVPIVGMEPAVKKALDLYGAGGKRVLAAATQVTVTGGKMRHLLANVDKTHLTDLVALPGLVRFAERGEFDSAAVDDYLRAELGKFDLSRYSSFVLGCTHFNFFKEPLRRLLPREVRFVDGNEGTVRQLARELERSGRLEKLPQQTKYYFSGRAATAERDLERLSACLERLAKMFVIE